MLSYLSVNTGPVGRLRHWCSSQYLRISPLHWEFRQPLPDSSKIVSKAIPRLSPGLSLLTYQTAYARFTPSKSEQRLPPSYYRGCWHEVSRGFLCRYRQNAWLLAKCLFFPADSSLQSEDLHPTRGVAPSGLPPLRKILDCSHP